MHSCVGYPAWRSWEGKSPFQEFALLRRDPSNTSFENFEGIFETTLKMFRGL